MQHKFDEYDEQGTPVETEKMDNEFGFPEQAMSVEEDLDEASSDELVSDFLDEIIDAEELEEEEDPDNKAGYHFSQQELIKLKADFDSSDPYVREQARELVYNTYKGLVNFVINKHYSSYNMKYHDDLVQQGNIGIITGFQQYNPDINGKFFQPSTLLTRYIRHEIREYIAKTLNDTSAKYHTIGRRMLEIIRRKKEAGEEVIPGDVANELGIALTTAVHAIEAINANTNKISLEATIKEGDTKVIDITPSDIPTPEEAFLQQEFKDGIMEALKKTLTPIQFDVMYYTYGFDNNAQRSRKEVARLLNLPEEDIRKITSSAKTKLDRYMRSHNMFATERRERSMKYASSASTKRSDADLQREFDSLDFSSLTDIGLSD